jgi:hypothetical protein
MPCYCRLQNGICCKEVQGGADGRRKQSPRVNRHKDVFRNEDREMNGGMNKVRRRRKPMLKEHLNELRAENAPNCAFLFFLWGWGIETEAGEMQRVGAVIRNSGAQLFFTYRGIERADTVIDVDNLRSRLRKSISKCGAA